MEQAISVEDLRACIKDCTNTIIDDSEHDKKRLVSFTLLDSCLELCKEGVCPNISQKYHKFLIDISIESYIQQRVYYYGCDDIGKSHLDRENMAVSKVLKIFSCPNSPNLNPEIFDYDKSQLIDNDKSINFMGARKRKAFWGYLKRNEQTAPCNNHDQYLADLDYGEAEGFIFSLIKDEKQTKQYWMNNFHILNGFDLFRCCFQNNFRNT